MSSYLERYQNGEYIQVWDELVALGDQVWTEPLYSDARAVANETMRRARHNVELLTERLKKLDYDFLYPDAVLSAPSAEQVADLDKFERKVGRIPLSLRAWVEVVGGVNFMGTYPRLSYYAAGFNPFAGMVMGNAGKPETLDLRNLMQSIQSGSADLPPQLNNMLNAFQKLTGQNIFGGGEPAKAKKPRKEIAEEDQAMSDPLVVEFSEISVDAYEEWQDYEEGEPFVVDVAPDIFHKSNISGGDPYWIELPKAAADATLLNTEWGEFTFVQYLRLSFEWGGFPGLQDYEKRDEDLLASFKQGLLPL
jgi:hypothetical protein